MANRANDGEEGMIVNPPIDAESEPALSPSPLNPLNGERAAVRVDARSSITVPRGRPIRHSCHLGGVASLVIAFLLTSCGEKPRKNVRDFSKSNVVSVTLGDPATENGDGLHHEYFEADGSTTTVTLGDVPCRHLKLTNGDIGYVYFSIDRTFKKQDLENVVIEVEYLSPETGVLGLQFDAAKSRKDTNSAFARLGHTVRLTKSGVWQNAAFQIRGATFRNNQNADADFRLTAVPPDLYVRHVTVKRLQNRAILGPDYSTTNVVSLALGDPDQESGQGLEHIPAEADGRTTSVTVKGAQCRQLKLSDGENGYFYFSLNPTFKVANVKDVTIDVEFLSVTNSTLGLEFDASGWLRSVRMAYVQAKNLIRVRRANTWQTATFQVNGATFKNSQNGGADFRLRVRPPDLYVRRVTVTRGLTVTPKSNP